MDLSTLFLGTMLTILPLIGAGLLAAMVLLERRPNMQLEPAPALGGRGGAPNKPRSRRGRPANGRRRRA